MKLKKTIKDKIKLKVRRIFDNELRFGNKRIHVKRNLRTAEKDVQKETIRKERNKLREKHIKYLNWIDGARIYHNWDKNLKLEWNRITVTEKEIIRKILFNKKNWDLI